MDNEPIIEAFNTIRVELKKLLEQQSYLPKRPINILGDTTTPTQPTQPGTLTEKPLTEKL